ncbi:MAG: 3-hydroxyacyl-ACP dehydratase FabZ [Pleurocapsa sp. SU_196_0]|nr:3-hydroxyacyl-ACP dehydratase FabZ [Pleurocapsa sp. SU_196_0]
MLHDIQTVLERLPHRYPFLMIDRVLERGDDNGVVWVKCLKNVTVNEPWCMGHFPGRPIMPGVLQLEAMAQSGVFLLADQMETGKLAFLTGVENARFKKPVTPGDQLVITSRLEYFRKSLGKTICEISVDGVLVSKADILFAVA